jgi:hypothetical protein
MTAGGEHQKDAGPHAQNDDRRDPQHGIQTVWRKPVAHDVRNGPFTIGQWNTQQPL